MSKKSSDTENRLDDKVFSKACNNLKQLFSKTDIKTAQEALKTLRGLSLSEDQLARIYSAIKRNLDDEQRKQKEEIIKLVLDHTKELKGDREMTEFTLNDEQKKFLEEHHIQPDTVKSEEDYKSLENQFTPSESFNMEEITKKILQSKGLSNEQIDAISSIEELESHLKPQEEKDDKEKKGPDKEEEFTLSDSDKEFLAKYGINEKAVTSKELLDMIKEQFADLDPKGEITLTEKMKEWLKEQKYTEEDIEKIKTVKDLSENINKTSSLDVEGKEREGGEGETLDTDWIKRKQAYYNGLAEKGTVADYKELRADSIFQAEFNGATVTYSSPTTVAVSPDAKISVFETIVQDPDNKHRPINFSDTMSKEMQARLYAACLLNDAILGKNAPAEMSEEQMKLLKAELGEERYAIFQKKYNELHKPAEPEKDDKDKEPKPFDDKVKEDIKKGLTDQYELAAMTADGRITFEKHMEDRGDKGVVEVSTPKGKDEDVAKYKELTAKSAEQTEFLKEKFRDNPAAFKDIIAQVLPELKEKAKSDELSTKLDKIKAKVDAGKKRDGENREDWQKDRADKLQQQQNVMGAKLGIPGYKAEGVTALAGDELDKYITDNKISAYTYGLLGGKDDSMVHKFVIVGKGDSELPGEQKKADFEKGKETREKLLNGGKERS